MNLLFNQAHLFKLKAHLEFQHIFKPKRDIEVVRVVNKVASYTKAVNNIRLMFWILSHNAIYPLIKMIHQDYSKTTNCDFLLSPILNVYSILHR